MDENEFPKLDKTVCSVFSSFEEADKAAQENWLSKSPQERLEYKELLRKFSLRIYGEEMNEENQSN
jgi:hypothetical protein